jgi:hypothetical protein
VTSHGQARWHSGGGGAGGYLNAKGFAVSRSTFSITVGTGGVGAHGGNVAGKNGMVFVLEQDFSLEDATSSRILFE